MAIVHVTHTRNGNQAIAYLQGHGHNGHARRNELVSGINCSSDIEQAKQSYHSTWRATHAKQKNSVEMYRYTQAFSTDELDPNNPDDIQKAHDMGLTLARKIMGNTNHVCLVATQKDGVGGNLHNHIFMCNQAFDTGKCIRGEQKNVKDLQRWNDEVLSEYDMEQPPTIEKPENSIKPSIKTTMTERKLREQGKYVWKDDLRNRIDSVQQMACSWEEYIDELANEGVNVKAFKRSAYHDDGTIDINKHLKKVSYSFTDEEGKERHARDTALGTDYGFENVSAWLDHNNTERVNANETTNEQWAGLVRQSNDEQWQRLSDDGQRIERERIEKRNAELEEQRRRNERQREQAEQQRRVQAIKRKRSKKRRKEYDGPEP